MSRILPNLLRSPADEGSAGSSTAAPAQTAEPALPKSLQDVTSQYFAPSDLQAGVKMIEHLTSIPVDPAKPDQLVKPIFNGDWPSTGDFPASHGLQILPIGKTVDEVKDGKKTGDKVRVTEHVVIAAVPTFDTLLNDEKGREYLQDAMLSAFSAKLRNSLVRAEDVASVKLPFSVQEFIERSERGAADQGLATYKALAPKIVKTLANKGIATNVVLLRQILSSAAFARALMPKVSQNVWGKVIEAAKEQAVKEKLPVTIFDHWRDTREQVAVDVAMDDIDLS